MEIVCAIVHQLTKNLTTEQIKVQELSFLCGSYIRSMATICSGNPFSSMTFQSKVDAITDLHEDMAAKQKARTTYDNILRLIKDAEISDPIRYLRAREIVHYQRFGNTKRIVQDKTRQQNFYASNPKFDG